MSDTNSNLPEVAVAEEAELSPFEKKITQLKDRMLNLVSDSIEVIECAVNSNTWKNTGKRVTRTQIFAASPIVSKFAPELEKLGSGAVHLHLNIPRPTLPETKPKIIEAKATEPSKFKK